MYNTTEVKSEDLKYVPLKDWKWKPEVKISFNDEKTLSLGRVFTSRRIGQMIMHGQGY